MSSVKVVIVFIDNGEACTEISTASQWYSGSNMQYRGTTECLNVGNRISLLVAISFKEINSTESNES